MLFLIIVAAVGAGLAYAITWLPVLMLGILLFLSVLIYASPTSGILSALGFAGASLVTLELSYLVAGLLFNRSGSLASTPDVLRGTERLHSKE